MAKSKNGSTGGLKKGVTFSESASQKNTNTHKQGGSQRAQKGSDRI
ncbi:hypothetical protein [Pontibacterium sp.]